MRTIRSHETKTTAALDTAEVTESLQEAAKGDWVGTSTIKAETTVVLYNGELGIYTVVVSVCHRLHVCINMRFELS